MRVVPHAEPGLSRQKAGRQAALNRHFQNLHNPAKAPHAQRQIKAMNPSWAERHEAQQKNPYAHITPRAERPLSDAERSRLKPTDTGPTPILGYTEKQIAHPKRTAKNLKHFKAEHERNTARLESQMNPLSRQNLSAAAEMTTNYHEIAHIRQHPVSGGLALAGFLPFGKAARGIELGVDAARGVNTAEHAATVARAAEEARGIKKIALQRRAVRLGRRTSPEDAQNILEQQRQNAVAKATKAARKNPAFVEHLPGETRPETGGELGRKVREAMRGVKKVYGKQKELQKVERLKRTAALASEQGRAKSFEELAGAQKALAGELPKAEFHNFEPLKPLVEEIKSHVDSLNMLPHDKNRLVNAIKAAVAGRVPAPAERKLIESVFGKEVKQYSPELLKERGLGGTLSDIGNIPRAIESSFDLSAALRQNLAAIAHDPMLVFRDYHETLHAAVSQDKFEQIMAEEIHGDPYYHMAKADGVPITEMNQGLNQKEEAIASNWAEHLHEIPGVRHTPLKYPLKAVSAGVKASDRNYIILLNRTRMRLYGKMVEQAAENGWRMDGPQGERLRKEIADTVATLTGRGNLGKTLTAHRATFNALFFSPGLMKSRINLLNPVWYLHASPFARQQRLKAGLRLYGTLMSVLAAAKMAGAKVSTDPTNADFGKIRIGNTRIDAAGGLTQYMRLIGQLSEGKITSSVTGKVEPLSSGPFKTSRGNVIQQFTRNKLAPVPGLAYDSVFGAGFGAKLNTSSVAGQMFVPLMLQDMYAISLQGPPWNAHVNHQPGAGPGMAAATFLPDLFGVGIQNYGGQKAKAKGSHSVFGGGGGSDFGGYGGSSGSSSFGGYGP